MRATDVTLALSKPKDISARTMLKGIISKCEIDGGPIAIVHVKLEGGEELSAHSRARRGINWALMRAKPYGACSNPCPLTNAGSPQAEFNPSSRWVFFGRLRDASLWLSRK